MDGILSLNKTQWEIITNSWSVIPLKKGSVFDVEVHGQWIRVTMSFEHGFYMCSNPKIQLHDGLPARFVSHAPL